ncbi:MAG: hypothetical protein ACREM3_04895 [Candidatus Rokuibacteriota bacterium]
MDSSRRPLPRHPLASFSRGVLAVSLVLAGASGFAAPLPFATGPTSLAPFEIYADGFLDLRGIVLDRDGNVFVTDREAGTIHRIARDRSRTVLATGLERPIGLALDLEGRLLVAEERAGRVVRLEPGGQRTAVVTGVKQPRWLAIDEDGTLYVSARRLTRDPDPEPDDESVEPEIILSLAPSGSLSVFADGFKKLQGLASNHQALFAATQGRRAEPRVDGVIFRIPILAGGSAGAAAQLGPADQFKKPVGLARDRLGALYLTTRALALEDDRTRRAIGKLHQDGRLTLFADRLEAPHGLAFDVQGNLYLADGSSGRVLRFLAPAAPAIDVPAVSRHTSLAVAGTTAPGARVDVFVGEASSPVAVVADPSGAFSAPVTMTANAVNSLEVFATASGGDGLTSSPGQAEVTHDDIAPAAVFQSPAGTHVRGTAGVLVRASDGGSGVEGLALTVDGQPLSAVLSPAPPAAALAGAADWTTTAFIDGWHTLAASAADRAGNRAVTSRVVIVDNTAPETTITGGPAGATQGATATFGFTGTDNLAPVAHLVFAWRLDGGPWSVFSSATAASLAASSQGTHLFEAKARDLAGNEDPTPAQRSFAVGELRVTITEPSDGATVPAGIVLVRGTVDAGGQEIGVTVNGTPAAVQAGAFVVSVPATVETTVLTAVAATPDGSSASRSIAVTVSDNPSLAVLLATPSSGVGPLTVSFSLTGLVPSAMVELDADGDGRADFSGDVLERQRFTFANAGVYVARATFADPGGVRTTVSAVVEVLDRATLDASLTMKWGALKDALRRGDVGGALPGIVAAVRDDYREMLAGLGSHVAQIDQVLTDVTAVEFGEDRAEYQMIRIDGGVRLSYFVLFVRDGDGIWRLKFF